MTEFDLDKAREALFDAHPADWDPDDEWVNDLLAAMAACVIAGPTQPGMCGNAGPGRALLCQLRAGHAGWHEGNDYEAAPTRAVVVPHKAHWGEAWTKHGQQERA